MGILESEQQGAIGKLIVFSSRALEHAILEGRLANHTKLNYLLLPMVLASLAGPFFVFRPASGEAASQLQQQISMVCSILTAYFAYRGIKQCYITNNQFGGKEFFERFAILFVPPLIKVILATVPLSLLLFAFVNTEDKQFSRMLFLIFIALRPIVIIAMYRMLNNSFQRLGESSGEEEASRIKNNQHNPSSE